MATKEFTPALRIQVALPLGGEVEHLRFNRHTAEERAASLAALESLDEFLACLTEDEENDLRALLSPEATGSEESLSVAVDDTNYLILATIPQTESVLLEGVRGASFAELKPFDDGLTTRIAGLEASLALVLDKLESAPVAPAETKVDAEAEEAESTEAEPLASEGDTVLSTVKLDAPLISAEGVAAGGTDAESEESEEAKDALESETEPAFEGDPENRPRLSVDTLTSLRNLGHRRSDVAKLRKRR